jgi:hypothetical protein
LRPLPAKFSSLPFQAIQAKLAWVKLPAIDVFLLNDFLTLLFLTCCSGRLWVGKSELIAQTLSHRESLFHDTLPTL